MIGDNRPLHHQAGCPRFAPFFGPTWAEEHSRCSPNCFNSRSRAVHSDSISTTPDFTKRVMVKIPQLQIVDGVGQRSLVWLAEQQMDVFGRDHVSVHAEVKAATHPLQTFREQVVDRSAVEFRLPTITTGSDKMRLAGFVKSTQTA